jgi:hypothetical protein
MKGGFMFKKVFVLISILFLSYPETYCQLKKLSAPNLYSEVEIYKDDRGNWYSTSVTVKFAKRTIDLPRGVKDAAFSDILIPETKEILKKVEKKYGKFALEKLFPDASYDDVYGTNIVTKEKVRLKDESQFYKLIFE